MDVQLHLSDMSLISYRYRSPRYAVNIGNNITPPLQCQDIRDIKDDTLLLNITYRILDEEPLNVDAGKYDSW